MSRRFKQYTKISAIQQFLKSYRSTLGFFSAISLFSTVLVGCFGSQGALHGPTILNEELITVRTDLTLAPMSSINSTEDDFGATMPLDTSLLFFTSARNDAIGVHSIFYAASAGSQWSASKLAVELNNEQSNGMPTISPGGETMIFTGCEFGFGDCDLYQVASGLQGGVDTKTIPWNIPRNMGLKLNGTYWDSQPSVSADGSMLYFASDRPGGLGGRDIWVCLREKDGSWGQPINVGEPINTPFEESTPWIAPDCRTLFFSSNGHPSIGGYDIFSIAVNSNTGVADEALPTNMGKPINSTHDDISLSMSATGEQVFLASNRPGGIGGYDLYQLNKSPVVIDPLCIVRGKVTDESGNPLFAEIEVSNLNGNKVIGRAQNNASTGEYVVLLRRGGNYSLTAEVPQYFFQSKQMEVPSSLPANVERRLDFTLKPGTESTELLVFFTTGGSTLKKESSGDLNRVVRYLQSNPAVSIEVEGHTDNTGDPEANQELSLRRAESVKSYLVGNRISADRIRVRGYGSSRPSASNDTEEGRAMNRRVEIRVLP